MMQSWMRERVPEPWSLDPPRMLTPPPSLTLEYQNRGDVPKRDLIWGHVKLYLETGSCCIA